MAQAVKAKTIPVEEEESLSTRIRQRLIGQDAAADRFIPYIEMYEAGLSPADRPIGVVLLLGSTGSGKSHSVLSLAEALHGSAKNVLRIDCGEFHADHEVAKLIGAPPGYLGHRETPAILSQQKINSFSSLNSDITIILLDEIEKAAPSMNRVLLGIFDTGNLRTGDNNNVNLERCIIFMTSNLGATELKRLTEDSMGYSRAAGKMALPLPGQTQRVGSAAVKRRFSPEFFNRIDEVITYESLTKEDCERILSIQIDNFNRLLGARLGMRSFKVAITPAAREKILHEGFSKDYGARELKRTLQRKFWQPVGSMVNRGETHPGGTVMLRVEDGEFGLTVEK